MLRFLDPYQTFWRFLSSIHDRMLYRDDYNMIEHLVTFWILRVIVLMTPYCSKGLPAGPLDHIIIMNKRRGLRCSKINI